jgi:hypothetical protein
MSACSLSPSDILSAIGQASIVRSLTEIATVGLPDVERVGYGEDCSGTQHINSGGSGKPVNHQTPSDSPIEGVSMSDAIRIDCRDQGTLFASAYLYGTSLRTFLITSVASSGTSAFRSFSQNPRSVSMRDGGTMPKLPFR